VKELQSIVSYEVIFFVPLPAVDSAFHRLATCEGCTDITLSACSCITSAFYRR